MTSILLALELADISRMWGKIQDVALDPVKNTLYYFVPFLGAMSSKFTQISPKDPIRSLIPDEAKDKILSEVDRIAQRAKLPFSYNLYTSLRQPPMSYGGNLSLTKPVLVLPYEWLMRPNHSSFGAEQKAENLDKNINLYTDNETRFLIAQEICHLKSNDSLIKTAAKVLLCVAAVFLYATPLGWAGTAAIIAGALLIYLIVDRRNEGKIDKMAVQLIGEAIKDEKKATESALSALKKLSAQNIEKRNEGFFYRLFITKSGNDLLDLKHPLITSRIQAMQKHLDSLTTVPMEPALLPASS